MVVLAPLAEVEQLGRIDRTGMVMGDVAWDSMGRVRRDSPERHTERQTEMFMRGTERAKDTVAATRRPEAVTPGRRDEATIVSGQRPSDLSNMLVPASVRALTTPTLTAGPPEAFAAEQT
jgi:hypothetical protein